MKRSTSNEINKVTGTIITVALRVIIVAVVALCLVGGAGTAYRFGYSIFHEASVDEEPGRDVRVTVHTGNSVRETADLLEKAGLIDNKASFVLQSYFFEYSIQPGTYILNTSQSSRDMLDILEAGPEAQETGEE